MITRPSSNLRMAFISILTMIDCFLGQVLSFSNINDSDNDNQKEFE